MSAPFEVRIEKLVFGGDGLAHHDRSTVFVPYVLPGELVRVLPVEEKKKFIRGRVENILEPAGERTAAACPHFGVCGGCHYQHIPYESQLRYKADILRETLARIGKIEWAEDIRTHTSPPFGYRNRAQWAVRPVGDPARQAIGYFQPSSSTLVPTEVCGILAPKLEAALAAFSRGFAAGKLPDNIRAIECFTDFSGEHLLVNVALSQKGLAAPVFAEKLREIAPNIESILFQDEQSESFDLSGPGYIQYEAAGHRYRVGHLSFFQVNRLILDDLVRAVAGEKPFTGAKGGLALDLYAGVGLFSIPLADHYERVIAVEGNVATARDLESNLKEHPASRARHADTETFLSRMKETPELIVLDPPRAGVPVPALQRIREIAPPQITYLSCDPATLARDLAFLTGSAAAGARYQISDITLYDIFPQTYHIEALVKLQRLG